MTDCARPHHIVGGFDRPKDIDALAELFAIQPNEAGWCNTTSLLNLGGQMLGGHIAALGMKAATMNAAGALPSAIHVLFLGAPDALRPCVFIVDHLRKGRRLIHRVARLTQDARPLAQVVTTLAAPALSAHAPAYSYDTAAMRDTPVPESLATRAVVDEEDLNEGASIDVRIQAGHPFLDIRFVPPNKSHGSPTRFWVRVDGAEQLSPVDQRCMLTVISDYWCTLPIHHLPGARAALGNDFITTSLDHALWFHTQPNCADWMLFEMRAFAVGGGMGMMQASIWTREGKPLASAMQRALIVPQH